MENMTLSTNIANMVSSICIISTYRIRTVEMISILVTAVYLLSPVSVPRVAGVSTSVTFRGLTLMALGGSRLK